MDVNGVTPQAGSLPTGPGARILRAADADAWQDGYRFLAAARDTAASVEENVRSARDAGYEKGFAEGYAAGSVEATELVLRTTLSIDRYVAGLEKEIGNLAMNIVHRVLGKFDTGDLVARAAAQAATEFRDAKAVKIAVHPASVDRVKAALAALPKAGRPAATVEGDPGLAEQACLLVSDFAVVNASIESQLRALAANLTSSPHGSHEPAATAG